jgi:hypothetical protein
MKFKNPSLVLVAVLIILLAAFSRIVLYPNNFSPILAMCIFFGAILKDKKLAFVIPVLAMLLSDIVFESAGKGDGFWGWGQILNYSILALITIIAFNLKKLKVVNILLFTIAGTVIFFLLSNSVFFFVDNRIYHLYTQDFKGYINCLGAGLPFLKKSLIADCSYSALFFGSYYLLTKYAFSKKMA